MAPGTPLHIVRDGRTMRVEFGPPIERRADVAVASRIRDAIDRGEMRSGDRLPSESELAGALGVSRDPIRRGLAILEAEKRVVGRQGSGWFVL